MVSFILRALRLAAGPVLLLLVFAPQIAHTAPVHAPVRVQATPYWENTVQHASWRRREGAPSSAVAIAQDSKGMMWFAGAEGLYRFDGLRFDHMDAIDGNKLTATDVSAVAGIGDALWVGYRFGGVSVFEHGKATHYGAAQGVPQRSVHAVAKTDDGVMWLGTVVGLYRRDGQRWTPVGASDGLTPVNIHSMMVTPDDALIVFTADGVYRKARLERRFQRMAGLPLLTNGELRADGSILGKTITMELFIVNPVTGAVRPLPLKNFPLPRFDVIQEKHGALWIMTSEGLHLLDPTQSIRNTYSMANGFSGRIVHYSMNDREGNTWFTTENGVDRFSQGRIHKLEFKPGNTLYMIVMAGDDGDAWVGSNTTIPGFDDTVYRVARDGSRVATPVRNVTASTRADDGALWFAGSGALWRVQGGQYRHWPLPADLRQNDIQALAMDGDGRLWLSIIGNGILTFDVGTGTWGRPADAALAGRTAISLHLDGQQRLWFGYPQNAMTMRSADGALRHVGATEGLEAGNVLVMKSVGGHMWIGGDRGLAWWDGRRFHTVRVGTDEELYGISGIVETASGDLWLHGAGGLAHILATDVAAVLTGQTSTAPFKRVDYLDGYVGMASQLRPIPTLAQTTDGRIWYATSAQAGWIDPASVSFNPLAPTPQVTALHTKTQAYPASAPARLPPGTDEIQIDFTAAAMTIPERARFRYRLVGLDTDWRETGARRQAFYTNMDPGEYRFEVLACNEDGVWSPQAAYLDIAIAPTFVQTAWFKLLCAAALALAGYGVFRWRVQLVTARVTQRMQERMDERVNERTRIARNLHDNFLQSVQALIMRFDRIKRRIPADDPLQEEIDSALDTADAVLLEGRDQVWALRSADDAQVGLEAVLREAATACGRQYGFDVRVETAGAGGAAPLPSAAQHEVMAIVMEALHNAGRHARADAVCIVLDYLPRRLAVRVTDNGCGIDEQVLAGGAPPGHWGLAGMRERAQLIGAALHIHRRAEGGTEVCLVVPLASAHH